MDAGPVAPKSDVMVIAIGASAGGFEALSKMLSAVPATVPAAFVVIQHLDPDHESLMADLLGRKTELDVRQASHAEPITAGTVYLIPPGTGMRIFEGALYLEPFSAPRGVRRPIDDFFMSLAEEANHRCAAVILSGTGADGSMGLQAVKASGGIIVAQSPEDAKYDGMPRSAIQTGVVDRILTAEEIVPSLMHILAPVPQFGLSDGRAISAHLSEITHLLRDHTGHDFSGYKRPTLLRRIERRMQLLGINSASQYIAHLRNDTDECHHLFRDLLINVTRFFRDTDNFEVLAQRALDPLVASAANGEVIRIWIPGCSTGEEAYSIAMICMYAAEKYGVTPRIQIFATDIDENALSIARLGRYPLGALIDIPEVYRARYVEVTHKDIQISPTVRDTIRFSSHNLIRDPAFSRMDLISCRNLFIYFNDKTQKTITPLFHFSLKASGYLFLGPSESIGEHDNLFASIDRQARLYRKRDVPTNYPVEFVSNSLQLRPQRETRPLELPASQTAGLLDISMRRLLETYAPASVTVNDRGEIVGSTGKLARYFEFSGHQSRELVISVARPGLRDVLSPILLACQESRSRVIRNDVVVHSEFGAQHVDVIADPLLDGHTLIVLNQKGEIEPDIASLSDEYIVGEERINFLEQELQHMRLRLRNTVEELETANEELKSSNEEMMSMNEELQSTNEELTTANDELKLKIDLLDVLNNDFRNFFESADLGVVILDAEMRLRAYTPRARSLYPLRDNDKGRLLSEIASPVDQAMVQQAARQVLEGASPIEQMLHVQLDIPRTYLMRVLPYKTYAGQIDGVTLTFLDITELTQIQDDLHQEQERLKLALEVGKAGVFELDRAARQIRIGAHARNLIGLADLDPDASLVPYTTFLSCVHKDDKARVRKEFERAFDREAVSFDLVFRVNDKKEARWLRIVSNFEDHAVALCQDYTAQKQQEMQNTIMMREMNHRIKNIFGVINSIIRLSESEHENVQEFSETIRVRIMALSQANTMPPDSTGKPLPTVRDLLQPLKASYGLDATQWSGPEVRLNRRVATSLSLILHEWATNACKYGALLVPGAKLAIDWSVTGHSLQLNWKETLPEDAIIEENTANSAGFGQKLVMIAGKQINATISTDITKTGHVAKIEIPHFKDEE